MLRRTVLSRLGFYQRAVAMAPHPDKIERGGEDSFMLCDHGIAVADGVGEHFTKWGIDAGIYARSLTRELYDAVSEAEIMNQPVEAKEAIRLAEEHSSGYRGTATLTVATLGRQPLPCAPQDGRTNDLTTPSAVTKSPASSSSSKPKRANGGNRLEAAEAEGTNDVLEVANIGDSVTLVLRKGKIIFKSQRQEHSTNHPYQLGNGSRTTHDSADVSRITVQPNDLVICASDGIMDNLFDCQIEGLLERAGRHLAMPADLATLIPDDYDFAQEYDTLEIIKEQEQEQAAEATTAGGNSQHPHQAFHPQAMAQGHQQQSAPVIESNGATTAAWYETLTVHQLNTAVRILVAAARDNSLNPRSYTPYIQSLTDAGFDQQSNKLDDCTVVIAQVLESPSDVRVEDLSIPRNLAHDFDHEKEQQRMQHTGGFMDNQGRIVMVASGPSSNTSSNSNTGSTSDNGADSEGDSSSSAVEFDALQPPDPYCGYP